MPPKTDRHLHRGLSDSLTPAVTRELVDWDCGIQPPDPVVYHHRRRLRGQHHPRFMACPELLHLATSHVGAMVSCL